MHPRSLFWLTQYVDRLSKDSNPLGVLAVTVEFERLWSLLTRSLDYGDGAKGWSASVRSGRDVQGAGGPSAA